ncbi:MAG: hypothetical protein AYK18_17130 [Theionarchaea archaeon DG-70]|nr:MAG: hypothetical protein AYK18_17130 [Theionarchaea archaeon DG-70]
MKQAQNAEKYRQKAEELSKQLGIKNPLPQNIQSDMYVSNPIAVNVQDFWPTFRYHKLLHNPISRNTDFPFHLILY